jgi:G3E family GTPase
MPLFLLTQVQPANAIGTTCLLSRNTTKYVPFNVCKATTVCSSRRKIHGNRRLQENMCSRRMASLEQQFGRRDACLWVPNSSTKPLLYNRRLCAATRADSTEDQAAIDRNVVDSRIPVTVLTGFLGSGKTTLLNRILTADHGHRIAVIENEFGEIDIDSDLVSVKENLNPEEEQILMLNNGCICCTVRSDLVDMLTTLIETKKGSFDRVLIETTGLANPGPIVQTFFLEPEIAENMKLDGILTLVDAKHVERHLDEERPDGVVNESVEQIAFADRIVLNKTDLVESGDLERLEDRIRSINSLATIQRAEKANVDMEYVLGIGGFDLEKVDEEITARGIGDSNTNTSHDHHDHDHECGPDCTHESHEHHEHHHHHHHHHHHGDDVSSVSITLKGNMNLDKVNYWLGGLIEVKSNDIYRMKGVLAIQDFDRRFVFQGVHMMFEGMPDRPWKPEEERVSKMVFIGRDLDEDIIREGFEQCLQPPFDSDVN